MKRNKNEVRITVAHDEVCLMNISIFLLLDHEVTSDKDLIERESSDAIVAYGLLSIECVVRSKTLTFKAVTN